MPVDACSLPSLTLIRSLLEFFDFVNPCLTLTLLYDSLNLVINGVQVVQIWSVLAATGQGKEVQSLSLQWLDYYLYRGRMRFALSC